jgi:hypothetical protein
LPALALLRKPLFGLAKRRKQPERYAKWGLKLYKYFVNVFEKYIDNFFD